MFFVVRSNDSFNFLLGYDEWSILLLLSLLLEPLQHWCQQQNELENETNVQHKGQRSPITGPSPVHLWDPLWRRPLQDLATCPQRSRGRETCPSGDSSDLRATVTKTRPLWHHNYLDYPISQSPPQTPSTGLQLVESRRNFFLPEVDVSHVYVHALALGCFYSLISTRTFSESADRVAGQLRGDKECPFSGIAKSARFWRKVPESDARSVSPA